MRNFLLLLLALLAINTMKAQDAKGYQLPPKDIADLLLAPPTPGVSVESTSGMPGVPLAVRIRGSNSITGSNEPLYVIDGDRKSVV